MILKTTYGKVVIEGRFLSVQRALEAAIIQKIRLDALDLRGASLKYMTFYDLDLSYVSFWGADLTGTIFNHCNLQAADFRFAQCVKVRFDSNNMLQTDFRGANFDRAHFNQNHAVAAYFSPDEQDAIQPKYAQTNFICHKKV